MIVKVMAYTRAPWQEIYVLRHNASRPTRAMDITLWAKRIGESG